MMGMGAHLNNKRLEYTYAYAAAAAAAAAAATETSAGNSSGSLVGHTAAKNLRRRSHAGSSQKSKYNTYASMHNPNA